MTSNTTANQIKITIKNLLGNDPRYLGIICAMEDEAESEGIGLDELNNLEIVGMGATEEEAEVLMINVLKLPWRIVKNKDIFKKSSKLLKLTD